MFKKCVFSQAASTIRKQSFQKHMIEVMNKDIEETAMKQQESMELFFHPTESAIKQIRRGSTLYAEQKKKIQEQEIEDENDDDSQKEENEDTRSKNGKNVVETYAIREIIRNSPTPLIDHNTPAGDNLECSRNNYLKLHSNGRYADEAELFCSPSYPKYENIPFQKKQAYTATIHTDTPSESSSEGEIKCHCSTSIGEIHLCRYARNIKARAQYLKKHPDKLLKYEMGDPNVNVIGKKVYNSNWVAYYVTK